MVEVNKKNWVWIVLSWKKITHLFALILMQKVETALQKPGILDWTPTLKGVDRFGFARMTY